MSIAFFSESKMDRKLGDQTIYVVDMNEPRLRILWEEFISGCAHFGLDTEGVDNTGFPAVLSLSNTRNEVLLIENLHQYPVPEMIIRFLANPEIVKSGFDLAADMQRLATRDILVKGGLDLKVVAAVFNLPRSLDGLGIRFIPGWLPKAEVNWEDQGSNLSEAHIMYAARDAVASRILLSHMKPTPMAALDFDHETKELLDFITPIRDDFAPMSLSAKINRVLNSCSYFKKKYQNDHTGRSTVEALLFNIERSNPGILGLCR